MRFFVVTTAGANQFQKNAITQIFSNKPEFGFWHWMSDFWIITSGNEALTSQAIRDAITSVAPGVTVAVFGVDPRPGDWALYSPTQWGEWLEENWTKEQNP